MVTTAAHTDPAASVVPPGHTPVPSRPVAPATRLWPPAPTDRTRGWIVTAVVTVIGAMVRLWQLGAKTDGGTPLFDEKYYAVQAAEMLRTGGVEDNQGYGVIVHPPLGKQLIAAAEWLVGYNPIGWRLVPALASIITIAVVIRVVRRMTRSTLLGGIAGVLLIADGVSHVMGRTALLDSIQVVFVIGAFACIVADRDQVRSRLAAAVAAGTVTARRAGPVLGARWWRFAAGVLLGCATAVKWNGAYWVVGLALLSLAWDLGARRQAGIRGPAAAVARRDLLPTAWSIGVVSVATYIASYWAWFTSETAWGRHDGGAGVWGALKALGIMTWAMLQTASGITTPLDPEQRHPWESKPFSWPVSGRPVLFYLAGGEGHTGCGAGHTDCVERILLVGTPALWWVSLPVLAWALWRAVGRLDWRYAAVLVGYGAGFLPWLLILDRQMYFFYMTPVAPFLVMGITLCAGDLLGPARRSAPDPPAPGTTSFRLALRALTRDRRTMALLAVSAYVGLAVANFVWLWPILVGEPLTPVELQWRMWLPSWG